MHHDGRASPESIILAQLAAMQKANLHDACKYMLFPGARPGSQLPKLMHSFMQGPSQLLINHTEVSPLNMVLVPIDG